MKIRKLHIKNYKVFNDLELDFTDANGKTLDTIVLAGLNGSGKTTVLEIIRQMFDGILLNDLKEGENSSIKIEVEMTPYEQNNAKDFFLTWNLGDGEDMTQLRDKLSSENRHFTFSFNLRDNDYTRQFITLPINKRDRTLKLIYLPVKDTINSNVYDIVKILHLDSSKSKMEELVLKEVRDEVFKNLDTPPRQSKEKAINQITKTLKGIDLNTQLVDFESEELIFKSINGQRIKFEAMSNGEQTLYFRAIYLNKLNPQDSIIMADEPEDALHPTWQKQVLKLYQNVGENNQVIVATHSPQVIGSANPNEVFFLEIKGDNHIEAEHPRYTKGHSIKYILKEMGADPNDLVVIQKVDAYLELIRKGLAETKEGLAVKAEIDAFDLDPNSEEMRRLSLSIKRFKAVGV